MEDIRHNQVADKAFEDKCRPAMVKFLEEQGQQAEPQDRIFYNRVPKPPVQETSDTRSPAHSARDNSTSEGPTNWDIVIEWNGVWKDEQGVYNLLECKHCMTAVLIPNMFILIEL
jgi:hypothetical protein